MIRCCARSDEAGQYAAGRSAGDGPDPGPQGCEQVTAEAAGVGQWLQRLELGEESVQGQRPPGVPAPVDGGLGYPGPGRYLLDGHSMQASLGQELRGRLQDRPVGHLAPRAATSGRRRGRRGGRNIVRLHAVGVYSHI